MAFIDDITIHLKAGGGGDGVVRWRAEKGKPKAGAAGGNGGAGGSVFLRAIRDIGVLVRYASEKKFEAQSGLAGMKKSMDGKGGGDLYLDIPLGSVVTNLSTGDVYQFLKDGEEVCVLQGGKGGFGNEHFKASTNVTPMQQTDGKGGQEADFHIELQLMVDAGFAGFPNAGKSSLLNALTNARSKVASYQFTTLEPNLGDFYGFILADIPGLIEGASEGKGLGHKFLRHIARTKLIFHCISLENEDVVAAYKTIRKELEAYSPELAKKDELIILTKTDVTTPEALAKAVKQMKKFKKEVFSVTIADDASVKALADNLVAILRKVEAEEKAAADTADTATGTAGDAAMVR